MNNRLFDTNIGSLDFQPMPKHFMVWDKKQNKFYSELLPNGKYRMIFGIWDMGWWLDEALEDDNIIIQSTNLFDKDGKEIFEGSIVEAGWDRNYGLGEIELHALGFVKQVGDGFCIKASEMRDGEYLSIMGIGTDNIKVRGHILSNPELLEGSNV